MSEGGAGWMTLWVVYERPTDFPEHYVVRQHRVNGVWRSVSALGIVCNSLKEAQEQIPEGLVNISRCEDDEPQIVEVWL